MEGKLLEFQRFAFPGTVFSGIFQCASAGIVGSLPTRGQDFFDLSTVPQPAGYQCSDQGND